MTTSSTFLIPVGESLSTAWEKVKGAKKTFWIAILLIFALAFGLGIIEGILRAFLPILKPILSIMTQIIIILLQMGIVYIGIQRALDLPINYRLLFHTFQTKLALKLIGLYLLKFLVLLPAILLVLVPGILLAFMKEQNSTLLDVIKILSALCYVIGIVSFFYLAIRIFLGTAFVLDKQVNPWEAIKMSFAATRNNVWRLIQLYFLQICIFIISCIPLGIGLIWTMPLFLILYGVIYRKLSINSL